MSKTRNPFARELAGKINQQRVVRSKKVYDRKKNKVKKNDK